MFYLRFIYDSKPAAVVSTVAKAMADRKTMAPTCRRIICLFLVYFFSAAFAHEGSRKIIPERLAMHCFLNQIKDILDKQKNSLTQQEQEIFSVINDTLNLMVDISDRLNSDRLFYNPEIEIGFLRVCQSFISLEALKPRHLRTLRNRILGFNRKIEKYISTRNSYLRDADLRLLEDIKKLNDLLLDHFLNENFLSFGFDEKLADWFFYRPKEIISDHKEMAISVLVVGVVVCSYFLYPYLKKLFSGGNENGEDGGDCGGNKGGLKNLGNTCYMNSVLQCIRNSEPLKQALRSLKGKKDNPELITKLISVIEKFETEDKVIDPGEFVELAREQLFKGKNRLPEIQNDASEFLSALLQHLSEVDEEKFNEVFGVERIILDECPSCRDFLGEEDKYKNRPVLSGVIINLSLGKKQHKKSLEDCFKVSMGEEMLKGNCQDCGRKNVNFTRNTYFSAFPELLIISLGRFNNKAKKREDKVTFFSSLDPTPYLFPEAQAAERDKRYDLTAFVCHSGSADIGHYTSYTKDSTDGKWYYCSDSIRREVEQEKVKEIAEVKGVDGGSHPYILFYQLKKD